MIKIFAKKEEAQKKALELDAPEQVYCLRHGEAGRPDYKVIKRGNGYAIKVIYCFYAGTLNAPKNHFLTTEEV
jgi:hypothetical protein